MFAFIKNLFLHKNGDGKISMAKIGSTIFTVAGIVVLLPTMGVAIPAGIITAATVTVAIGAKLGFEGLRNAADKTQPPVDKAPDK